MSPVLSSIPLHWCREETCVLIDPAVPTHVFRVRVQHNPIRSGHIDADTIVAKALRRVEVENEDDSGSLKHDDLVALVLKRDVSLGRR